MIVIIKIIHTVIWLLMVFSVFYTFYSGVSGNINYLTYISISLVFIEAGVQLYYGWNCPVHLLSQKLSGDKNINDTFLPRFVFKKGNKLFYAFFFSIGLMLILARVLGVLNRVK